MKTINVKIKPFRLYFQSMRADDDKFFVWSKSFQGTLFTNQGDRVDIYSFHIAVWRFNLVIGKLEGLD